MTKLLYALLLLFLAPSAVGWAASLGTLPRSAFSGQRSESAWEAGANAVLPIPFDVLDLHTTIRILLGGDDD
jgi:hypothetical protein